MLEFLGGWLFGDLIREPEVIVVKQSDDREYLSDRGKWSERVAKRTFTDRAGIEWEVDKIPAWVWEIHQKEITEQLINGKIEVK